MAYEYNIINKLDQFGITIFTVILKDSDNILPELLIPAFLNSNEINENSINDLCNKLIIDQTNIQTDILNKNIIASAIEELSSSTAIEELSSSTAIEELSSSTAIEELS